jgi:hypothetical protein
MSLIAAVHFYHAEDFASVLTKPQAFHNNGRYLLSGGVDHVINFVGHSKGGENDRH